MANQTLKHVFFPLYLDKAGNGTGAVRDKAYGVFACRQSTQRFLDIPDSAIFTGDIERTAKKGTRVFTLADGTVLAQSTENSDGQNAEYTFRLRKRIGQRNVLLKTGKRIYPSDPKKPQTYTISFAFPAWATIPTISDALGELIPPGKLSVSAGDTEIFPQFTIKGGGTYGILKQATAQADNKAGTSKAALKAKLQADGGNIAE